MADLISREQVAQAADEVAETFMARYRARPFGAGDEMYNLFDAFTQFAQEIRTVDTEK